LGPPEESYPTATPPTALEPPVASDAVQQGSAQVVANAAMVEVNEWGRRKGHFTTDAPPPAATAG